MSTIPTTPPSGFRDFLPDSCALRAKVIETISRVYRSYGFCPIDTPACEDLTVLMGKAGGENEKLIFKIMKRGEKLDLSKGEGELADMGLRFDLTLPLARYYSRHRGVLPTPFKAFHIGPVWRAERAQKGRYREFIQCDADILGSESVACEIEVISAVLSVFKELGLDAASVLLNDRRLLFALCDHWHVPEDKRTALFIAMDKLDKVGFEAVLADITEHLGGKVPEDLRRFVQGGETDLDFLQGVAPEPMAGLLQIRDALAETSDAYGPFTISPTLVRGLDYYTGPVFEFRHPGLAGSIGGGGRYDRLTEKFGGPKTPACGLSIGFERLMLVLEEAGAKKAPGPDACLTVFSEELRLPTLRLAKRLRVAGLSVDVYPGGGKLKAQFKYADGVKARFALVLGPDEAAAGKVNVKELASGAESSVLVDDLAAFLKTKAA
ncbi:MAG: histidine--tRNA ligase [Elusimicrobia bacterium]|nr:histidine--tRNA ligase [Elusimicrobiota bacterium]